MGKSFNFVVFAFVGPKHISDVSFLFGNLLNRNEVALIQGQELSG